jgi:hypothetical protein
LYYIDIALLLSTLLLLPGCADPIEHHIARLVEGGEGAEEAKMELNLAKKTATTPLIAAFQNKAHPARARVDLAQALYRLYLREADQRILTALAGGLEDETTEVRAGVVRALGGLGKRQGIQPLLERLGHETEDIVRREILTAMELLAGTGGLIGGFIRIDHLTAEQKTAFVIALKNMSRQILSDTLRLKTLEWLEVFAEEKAVAAHNLTLQADIARAEKELLAAKDLVPDSKNINQKLGLLYYRNGEPEKGQALLDEFGMVAHVSRLTNRPRIDGVLGRGGAELSVTPVATGPLKGKYLLVSMHVERKLYIRIGESPVGPFGPRIDIYRTQEPDAGQEIYTYNAKAHPSLSPTGEWLVTYNVNSRDWDSLVANGDIYRPRFLWVRFEAE